MEAWSPDPMPALRSDVWALSLDGTPAWQELTPPSSGPGTLAGGRIGVFDPTGDRLVVLGSNDPGDGSWSPEAWSLSLGDTPTWTPFPLLGEKLERPSGSWSAVYDPAGHRMILIDQGSMRVSVHALDLLDAPRLHRFCPGPESLTPASIENYVSTSNNVVLAPDGLFISTSGGAFRFDLATRYCD
jgi:hypothetical protein